MLKNYLKVALRYFTNNKRYTFINLTGLTLGLCCFLLLNLYVSSEKSFDSMHPQVYRLLQQDKEGTTEKETAQTGPRVGLASREQFPEINAVTQIMALGRLTVGNDPANKHYEFVSTIDSSFFEVFNLKLKEGTPATVFSQANGILITAGLAKKYFGNEPALHKTLKTNMFDGVVAGVLEDIPENSHLEAYLMLPGQTAAARFDWWKQFHNTNWHRNACITYMKLDKQANITALENKITGLAKAHWPEDQPFKSQFALQSVRDIHLYDGEVLGEINKSKGNAFYVKIFFWIALVILLVACFNYTGLLNVAFINRSKEIGVRKVMGAGRLQLIRQFLVESLLLTATALVLAVMILVLLRPAITNLLGSSFNWSYLPAGKLLLLAAAGLGISLLSISYPTYIISRLAPVAALKDGQKKTHGFSFQKTMLLFQFIAAIGLIACTALFYKQVRYLQHKKLGFESEGIVVIDINSRIMREKFEAIKTAFTGLPEVKQATVTSRVPGEWKRVPVASVIRQGQAASEAREMIFIGADKDFLNTYQVTLQQGANFTGLPADSSKVLINSTAARALGLENPVGQWIEVPLVNFGGDNTPPEQPIRVQIAGVTNDFHFEDSHLPIRSLIIGAWNNPIQAIDYYSLRVSTADWSSTIASLQNICSSFDKENPMEYNILDDKFKRFFENDVQRSRLLMLFTGIVILITVLGLFAITMYILKNRTREIGIRRVLGASLPDLVQMVTADFIKLVLIGAAVAIPLAWWVMSEWLQEFAYRISLAWWVFAVTVLAALLLAFVTVSMQTIKAALGNPVKSLRTE